MYDIVKKDYKLVQHFLQDCCIKATLPLTALFGSKFLEMTLCRIPQCNALVLPHIFSLFLPNFAFYLKQHGTPNDIVFYNL